MSSAIERLATIDRYMVKRADSFTAVLPPSMSFERFNLAVRTEIQRSPSVSMCTPSSIVMASFDAAKLGLEINSVLGEAYLVPFRKNKKTGESCQEAQLIVGYRGYTTLALQSPRVLSVRSAVVLEGDDFTHEEGTDQRIHHVPKWREHVDVKEGKDVTHAYAIAKLCAPGTPATDLVLAVLVRAELEYVRTKAQGASRNDSPWNQYRPRMYEKSAIRRMSSKLPLSDGMRHALLVDGDAERTREERDRVAELRRKVAADVGVEIQDAEVFDADEGP